MHLIKRYPNGRFYDTVEKKYISMKKIARLMETCENITIVSTSDGSDVTFSVASGIKADHEGFSEDRDRGGAWDKAATPDWTHDETEPPHEAEEQSDAERIVSQLFKKGEVLFEDVRKRYETMWHNISGMPGEEIDKLIAALKRKKRAGEREAGAIPEEEMDAAEEAVKGFREEIDRLRKNFQDWLSGNIDERIEAVMERMNLATRDQVRTLTENVETLNRKVEKLEMELLEKELEGKDPAAHVRRKDQI